MSRATKSPQKKTAASAPKKPHSKPNLFHQRLAELTAYSAQRLLGDNGTRLLTQGDSHFEIDTEQHVFLGGDLYRVRVPDAELDQTAIVTITLSSDRKRQLLINCDHCQASCAHMGAALVHLLDARSTMGLAAPPDESVPLELLTEEELLRRALAEREHRASEETMKVRSMDPATPWTDYVVTSAKSGKTYRVALRGSERGVSYCSCPDFRTNHLGICKHILSTLAKVEKTFPCIQTRTPLQTQEHFRPCRLWDSIRIAV